MKSVEQEIAKRLYAYENPRRTALSKKYPLLKTPIIFSRRTLRNLKNTLDSKITYTTKKDYFPCVIARHQSVLRRQLGTSDAMLQEQKITNLAQAVKSLDGVVIKPNNIFSLWQIIGQPKYTRGYVDGMLLSNGKVVSGVGGGLCQLSNFLYWIFLHTPTETKERYHHSMDVFPDSGRILPFGGGATVLYNFIDLKVKNISKSPWQLKLWLTDNHLKGQILSPVKATQKFHVLEKNHCFVKRGTKYFRYNEIYRRIAVDGKTTKTELVAVNFAPVLYRVTKDYLIKNNFKVLDFTGKKLKSMLVSLEHD
jgi:vancomycin resistance protein VanW